MTPPALTVLARAVAPIHPPGGMERAVYEQLVHLRMLDVPLSVVTQPPIGRAQLPADLEGITWQFVRYGHLPLRRNSIPDRLVNYPLFVARVGQRLRDRPNWGQIVHAHGLLAAAVPPGCPLVYAPHGLEEFSRSDWRKYLAYAPMRAALRRAAGRAAAVLATDTAMTPAVATALRLPAERVRVVPNGVSLARLDALIEPARQVELTARLALTARPLRLITCARLERNKGLHVAMQALARLGADLPPSWGWWIVGVGREEAALRQQAASLGLAWRVHILGRLSDADLHNLLPQMSLYLAPSLYEGSSIATLEAMSHRLPVLAARVGGLPDKVLPGRTGYLCAPNDPADLAAVLRGALSERWRWPALGLAGRQLVAERFDWPAIARQLLDLYTELADQTQAADN
jgi:glycosyltransferase involved in cell wall biosynthesis